MGKNNSLTRGINKYGDSGISADGKDSPPESQGVQDFFQQLMDAPDVLISKADMKGVFQYVNQGFATTLGYRIEEMLGKNALDFIMNDEHDRIKNRFEELSRGQHLRGREIRFKSKDGTIIHMRVHAHPFYNEKRVVNGIITIGYDITARIKIEEALRESEERYRLLFDHVSDLVIIVDKDGRIREISPSLEHVFGQKVKEFIGMYAWDFPLLTMEQKKGAQDRMAKISGGIDEIRQEYTVPAKDGTTRVIETVTSPLFKQGTRVGAATIGRDITDRIQMEAALRESEEKYRLIFTYASDVIVVTEEHGIILNVSPSVENLLGYKPDDFIGKHIYSVFVLDKVGQEKAAKTFKEYDVNASTIRFELQLQARDGSKKYVEVVSSPIIKDGRIKWTIHLCRDITERRDLYEKALELNKIRSRLVTTAAHELKTPLTSIYGFTELFYAAKKAGKNIDKTFDLEDFNTVLRNCDRLKTLLDDFLDVGRIESSEFKLQPQEIDVADLITNAVRAVDYMTNQKHIKIVEKVDPFRIKIDPRRMEQVIINLLSNSVKYSPEKTTITVYARQVEDRQGKIAQILVTDQGYGFTPEELAVAMQPFGRIKGQQEIKTAIKGTGLGLFICKNIVEQHSGTLKIQSEGQNKGTTVTINLPL